MMKKSIIIVTLVQLLIALPLFANVTSVTVNPAATTGLSNGNSYYLAAKTYTFNIQATDPLAGDLAYWGTGNVVLTITNGATPVTFSLPISSLALGGTTTIGSATADSSTAFITNNSPSWSNLNYQIEVTFAWNSAEFAAGLNDVIATVNETTNASSGIDTSSFNFGVCSSIRVLNFTQSGVAADGYVNPWHSGFNVTGSSIVYNVTGAGAADTVNTIADLLANEITGNTTLIFNPSTTNDSCAIDANEVGGVSYAVAAQYINTTLGAGYGGTHQWRVRANMATGGITEDSANYLSLVCNRIRIDTITFINGGGVNPYDVIPHPYYRSINIPGTQVQITASRESGGGTMIGNTTIEVRNLENTQNFTIQIANGATTGTGNVPNPSVLPGLGTTETRTYQVISITGSAFDNEQDLDVNAGSVTQTPANPIIHWDNQDPPGNNDAPGAGETPFTGWGDSNQTASSFTLIWRPLTDAPNDPPYDDDFYSYRIYYRESDPPGNPWQIVDRSILGYGLGGAGDTYRLDLPATGSVTISGLQPFTQYDYMITAVDVFGQEVEHTIGGNSDALYINAPTGDYGQITTYATTINVSVTDGITTYNDTDTETDFEITGNPVAANRPLRKSAIKVSVYIVTSGEQPDEVNIILAQDNGTGSSGTDLIISGPALNSAVTYERFECRKTSPNTWTTQISSEDQFFNFGSSCRFLVETVKNGTPTYSDANSETEDIATANPNDFEYTFQIATEANFAPWPTRILNNVITDKNPVAYPSYYLSDDAYVTITVHDIKGRTVATLTDGALRKGGQNIKENGWRGRNKSRRKLGIGLYYIHFKAKRASDGRTILNETKKVVIAK
ncbi:MAG: fibronectin type III domain-containing protein [Spirochaetes bacterium]|nr:fibronectin type III domain-containing protein [Spirochaetota bacterium]